MLTRASSTLKPILWQCFNRHQQGALPNIALVGSRRSGSTLLMQMIAQNAGVKYVDQPFSPFVVLDQARRRHPVLANGPMIAPNASQQENLDQYIKDIIEGFHVNEPWKLWSKEFKFRSDRLVFKTTAAQFLLDLLVQNQFQVILYFRHPIAQALSCMRNDWGDKLQYFQSSDRFKQEFLTREQGLLLQEICRSGSDLQKYVLSWCCENLPLWDEQHANTPSIFYEDLVAERAKIVKLLAVECQLAQVDEMYIAAGQASASVKSLSAKGTRSLISQGNAEKLIYGWQQSVTGEASVQVQNILDHFPGCPYRAGDALPRKGD
ncbi:hypothetical protein GCM10007939_02930 [Amylibacter marinus]|uniref:Sulfotransferase family protein n=1 Tax=Amylibacter marinus TaxID=1475483 RepID=A0ABQ5VRH1_9RHOB|nr:sulfotransferase domain-containing protein [Amylibacter marinus]GLQ34010.1 hypothetical protein GCM10007939_02930 [Amylibacter marinus]